MLHKAVEQIEQAATVGSYGASTVAIFLGLTYEEWGIASFVVGIIGVIATTAFNAWFKMKYQRGNGNEGSTD